MLTSESGESCTHFLDSVPCILLVFGDGDDITRVEEVENVSDLLDHDRIIPFRDQAESFLIGLVRASPILPERFPTMHADIDDDILFVEWILGDTRAGFVFSSDPSESGWFVLSRKPDGTDRFRGGMDDIEKAVSEVLGILDGCTDMAELRHSPGIYPA